MKILQTLHFYLPKHSAGTEIYTRRLCQGLSVDHEVQLFFSEKIHARRQGDLFTRRFDNHVCHVFVNNLVHREFAETYQNADAERRFAEVLDSFQPDLVHFQHLMFLSLGLPRIARQRSIPTVMTLHDFWLLCPRMGQLLNHRGELCEGPSWSRCQECLQSYKFGQTGVEAKLLQAIARVKRTTGVDVARPLLWAKDIKRRRRQSAAVKVMPTPLAPTEEDLKQRARAVTSMVEFVDHVLSPSQTVLEMAVGNGLPRDKISHLPNGFWTPPHRLRRQPRTAAEDPFRVGFVGTLAPHKGVHVLIDAFERANLGQATLSVYGSDAYQRDYGKELRKHRSPSIQFMGRVPNREIPRVMRGLDVIVVPSLWFENAPVTIAEARDARVPVVATDLGGMAEAIIDGVDGRLFPAGDSARLAEILEELCRRPQAAEELASRGPAPLTMEEHLKSLNALYQSLRGSKRP